MRSCSKNFRFVLPGLTFLVVMLLLASQPVEARGKGKRIGGANQLFNARNFGFFNDFGLAGLLLSDPNAFNPFFSRRIFNNGTFGTLSQNAFLAGLPPTFDRRGFAGSNLGIPGQGGVGANGALLKDFAFDQNQNLNGSGIIPINGSQFLGLRRNCATLNGCLVVLDDAASSAPQVRAEGIRLDNGSFVVPGQISEAAREELRMLNRGGLGRLGDRRF